MKLKKSHILLIVMSLFLLVSIGSVCAADNGIDTDAQLTDSGIEPIATDDGSTQEKTSTEVVSQDVRVNYNETAEIPVTVKDNSSQTIEITKENITVTEGNKTIGFNYNNSQIIITDNLAVGNHSLIISYLGNGNYTNSSTTITLSILGNITLNTPASVNFNSTKTVEIPVNVTNGVDLIDVTSDDFIITITNGNKTIETINGTKLIYENGKLIFTFNNTENTTFTAVIVYREDETKVLSKVLTLKRIYNVNVIPVNTIGEYQSGNFTFKIVDVDTGEIVANKMLTLSYTIKANTITFITSISRQSNASGIVSFNNKDMFIFFGSEGTALNVGNNSVDLSSTDGLVIQNDKKVNLTILPATADIKFTSLTHEYKADEYVLITVTNANTGEPLKGIVINLEIPSTTQKKFTVVTNNTGQIKIPTVNLTVEKYAISAKVNDTTNLKGNTTDATIVITEKPLNIKASDVSVYYNTANPVMTIKVTDKNGKAVSGAYVTLNIAGYKNPVVLVTDSSGNAKLPAIALAVGKHKVTISLKDDPRYKSSTLTKYINVMKTTARFYAPYTTVYYKQGTTFNVKLLSTKNNKPIYGGKANIRIYINNNKYYNFVGTTGTDGYIRININSLEPGIYKVGINGKDGKNFTVNYLQTTIKVLKTPGKLTPTAVTAKYKATAYFKVKAVNSKTNTPIYGIKIGLKVYTGSTYKVYYAVTNAQGIAQFNTNILSVGTHKVIAYSANKFVTAKTATSSIKITK